MSNLEDMKASLEITRQRRIQIKEDRARFSTGTAEEIWDSLERSLETIEQTWMTLIDTEERYGR